MSLPSDFYHFAITSLGSQWKFKAPENMQFYLKYQRLRTDQRPPPSLHAIASVAQHWRAERPVIHLQPRRGRSGKHLIFLHGGAFVNPMALLHWQFIQRLMMVRSDSVSVPLYGLVPEYDHRDAYRLLRQHYEALLEDYAPDDIILMGDSSGGGLALAFSQWIHTQQLPLPGAIVMISPWLDLSLSNPEIEEVQERDSLLAVPGSQEAARLWAAGMDLRVPMLSPIYGPLKGMPPMCLLIGTNDILLPDARRLRDRARESQTRLTYQEYPDMYHLWAMLPSPEGKEAVHTMEVFMGEQARLH